MPARTKTYNYEVAKLWHAIGLDVKVWCSCGGCQDAKKRGEPSEISMSTLVDEPELLTALDSPTFYLNP